ILDLDHPDIEDFIRWKVVEEQKVAALVSGSKLLKRNLNAILKAVWEHATEAERYNPAKNPGLRHAIAKAYQCETPANYVERMLQLARQGVKEIEFEEYDTDWNSKAYYTVSGQNSNNSVRVPNEFMDAVAKDGEWNLYWRTELERARAERRAPKAR